MSLSSISDYILMHKDRQLALFRVNREETSIIKAGINEKNVKFLPVRYGRDIAGFLLNRGIPVSRKGLSKDLGSLTSFQYMLRNLG